ncbi:MAG: LytR C-terminal domain-containing protein [bacterium]|nr:LytR C-terminal domain-containing protein [bacterium]
MAGRRGKKRSGKGRGRRVGGIVLAGSFILLLLYSLALRYDIGLDDIGRLLERDGGETSPPASVYSPPAEVVSEKSGEEPLRLQILNATGIKDLALQTGEKLRLWNVDAVDRGNAPSWPFPETMLIVRNGHRRAIYELARKLDGIPVVIQRRPDLMLDGTLILGHDWEKYNWPASN